MAEHSHQCEACGELIRGTGLPEFGDAYIAHVRSRHPDWPFPDTAIRNVAEATQRLSADAERLDVIGDVNVHPVTTALIPDWLSFFDHDAFAGNPVDAVCYCTGPHVFARGQRGGAEMRPWRENRELMTKLLSSGRVEGYLAYADGRPAGWVNASKRSHCSAYRLGTDAKPADEDVISVACFVIAPPYRRHGLAMALLQRLLDDAPGRGAAYVEAYPLSDPTEADAGNFRGHPAMFTAQGFEVVEVRERDTVMRRRL